MLETLRLVSVRSTNVLGYFVGIALFVSAHPVLAQGATPTREKTESIVPEPALTELSIEALIELCARKVEARVAQIRGQIDEKLDILLNNPPRSPISIRAENDLRALGRSACDRLILEIQNEHGNPNVAPVCARVLGSLLVDPDELAWQERARNQVAELLRTGDDRRKVLALMALEHDEDLSLVPAYVSVLIAEDIDGRILAANKLGALEASEAIAPLKILLDHEDYRTRKLAVETLGKIDPDEASIDLLSHLDDPSAEVTKAVYKALGQTKNAPIGKHLEARLSDLSTRLDSITPDPIILLEIDWLLTTLGKVSVVEGLNDLQDLLRKTTHLRVEQAVERAMISILRRIEESDEQFQNLVPVRTLLTSTRQRLQKAAIRAITTQRDEGSLESLYPLLSSPEQQTILMTIRAIGAIGQPSARSKLRAMLKPSKGRDIVVEAAYALADMGDFSGVDEVVAPYKQRLSKNRANVYAMVDLADGYKRLHKYTEAVSFYKKALKSNRLANRATVVYRLAATYSLLGQVQSARTYLQEAINTGVKNADPDNDPDFENLRNAIGPLTPK